ncbi:helicase-exonuclease AddAB subunit AddA [Alkaliphilus transvaalensis]|uniref:helicase-exonuclease AddAB subunit AddA n=1 Tax=Alkaliphilus transvaalensis TaxID=114628 RepID=UPI000478F11D|nr:helicase-exonuclease AddAB subunit AddA [Alkaliphilus transvaalensis]
MTKWTKEQKSAIVARDSNLLISAAAGSGKTAVLVERIIGLIIDDGVDIDQLLIVTFTNAAAGEMRERIAAAIIKALDSNNGKEEHIRRQMTLLNKATITTLHSFCIEVVKRHFHLIEIDPSFRIGDVSETELLKMEALTEVFEAEYEKAEGDFLELVEAFGGNREDIPLQELVLKIFRFIQSQPKPYLWLQEKCHDFNMTIENFEDSSWGNTIKKSILIRLIGAKDALLEAREICQKPSGPDCYMEAVLDDLQQVEALMTDLSEGVSKFHQSLKKLTHMKLARGGKDIDPELKEEAKGLRDQAKDILKKINVEYFNLSPEEYVEDINLTAPLMKYLSYVVEDFGKRYQTKKTEKGIVDFNDLEHYTLSILEDELVAKEYRGKFEYIFIDEYQDSNIVQETIIQRINREENLFLVGDVKQSIYRFRLADPSLFIEKYEKYQLEEGSQNRRIDLAKNFRSRGEILKGVNYLFKNMMTKTLGEVDYDEAAYLYQGREFPPIDDPSIELNLIERDYNGEELEEELELMEDIEVEAKIVANRIKVALEEEIFDEKINDYRKVDYKDIVILLRATQNWGSIFLETFIQEGIPAYADANAGYFQTTEITIFLNLLKVIDNKRQDIPLLSVMRSPIGGFTIDELIEIRITHRKGSYYEAIEKYVEEKTGELKEKLQIFKEKINHWFEISRYMKLDDFIWKILTDSGYYHYVGAMPGGLQRQANLRILLDRAAEFQKTSIKGLFNFIHFVGKLQSNKGDLDAAKILSENDNVVRIMSIHKSKGLEFPYVIVAGMGKNFNLRDSNDHVLLHKELGLGPRYVDSQLRVTRDTIAKIAMKDQIKIESLSEEMRVLYVALTRPKDKLILIGSMKNLEKQCKKWTKGLGNYSLFNAKCYLDWVGSVLIRHPLGEKLRELAGDFDPQYFFEDESKWTISFADRGSILAEKVVALNQQAEYKEKLSNPGLQSNSNLVDPIQERLNWQYPYEKSLKIPSKLSVTDIKESHFKRVESLAHKIPPLVKMPKFMESVKEFSPAEKGTILHFVLQHLQLKTPKDLTTIEEEINMMIVKELLTAEEAETVDVGKLVTFFNSEIGIRMRASDHVYREVPFNLRKKAVDVIDGLIDCDDELLIQGVIDCYFQEGEDLILLDYKSDFVLENNLWEMKNKYESQLELYQEALEKITGKNIKERYLYLFYRDEVLEI